MDIIYLILFLLLLISCWILLFIRAQMRRKILIEANKFFLENDIVKDDASLSYKLFTRIFYDIKSFRILKKSVNQMPIEFKIKLNRYRLLDWITISSILLVIFFALFAHKLK